MRPAVLPLLLLAALAGGTARAAVPADTLFGTTIGQILTIDTADGTITFLPTQDEFFFLGLAFGRGGRLFASACLLEPIGVGDFVDCAAVVPPSPLFQPHDQLVELDPATGAVIGTIGGMTDATGLPLDVGFLATAPGGDLLYAIDAPYGGGPNHRRLWAIDPDTAEATLIADRLPAGCQLGTTDCSGGFGLATRTDGSLLHTYFTIGNPLVRLLTLDPETGAELDFVEVLREQPGDT